MLRLLYLGTIWGYVLLSGSRTLRAFSPTPLDSASVGILVAAVSLVFALGESDIRDFLVHMLAGLGISLLVLLAVLCMPLIFWSNPGVVDLTLRAAFAEAVPLILYASLCGVGGGFIGFWFLF